MPVWKLTKTFTQSLASEYDRLVESTLNGHSHPARKKSFILSREALRLTLLEMGETPLVPQLKLQNFCLLNSWPDYLVSLSHTRLAGAAVLVDRRVFVSAGIDIELQNREVSEAVARKITGPEDLPLRKIELWCLKEAAYKCLMNTGKVSAAVRFSQIEIRRNAWFYPPKNLSGQWELTQAEGHIVALAFMLA